MRVRVGLLVLMMCGAVAEAKFAATENFSGRNGVDCGACHTPQLAAATPAATVLLEGVPKAWEPGGRYALTIRVDGGPTPLPGRPQAGFDMEVDQGALSEGEGMAGLLRFPDAQEATYTGNGTLVREWSVVWTASDDGRRPTAANVWLAGLAANGNHNMDGPEVLGEVGDSHDKMHVTVPPSEAAVTAWLTAPLDAPTVIAKPSYGPFEARRVRGEAPANAERVEWRVDDGAFGPANGTRPYFFDLPNLAPGPYLVEVRAGRGEIVSNATRVEVQIEGPASAPAQAPAVGAPLALLPILLIALLRRK